jgi:hypothetical protein
MQVLHFLCIWKRGVGFLWAPQAGVAYEGVVGVPQDQQDDSDIRGGAGDCDIRESPEVGGVSP